MQAKSSQIFICRQTVWELRKVDQRELSLPTAYITSTLNNHTICSMTIAINLGKGGSYYPTHLEMEIVLV